MHYHIHDADQRRNFLGRHQANEAKVLLESARAHLGFEPAAPGAIANQEKFYIRASVDQRGSNREEIIVAFKLEQPRDFANDDVLRCEAKTGAQLDIVCSGKKWAKIETAQDFS